MDRSKWNKTLSEKGKPHRKYKDKYFLLIGVPKGKKKFVYVSGHRYRGQMLTQMHQMMLCKTSKYFLMEVQPCPNSRGAISELLLEVNRNRGDEKST